MVALVQDCRSDSQAQDNKGWHTSLPKGEGEALSDVQRWDFVEEEQGAGGLLLFLSIIRPLRTTCLESFLLTCCF